MYEKPTSRWWKHFAKHSSVGNVLKLLEPFSELSIDDAVLVWKTPLLDRKKLREPLLQEQVVTDATEDLCAEDKEIIVLGTEGANGSTLIGGHICVHAFPKRSEL